MALARASAPQNTEQERQRNQALSQLTPHQCSLPALRIWQQKQMDPQNNNATEGTMLPLDVDREQQDSRQVVGLAAVLGKNKQIYVNVVTNEPHHLSFKDGVEFVTALETRVEEISKQLADTAKPPPQIDDGPDLSPEAYAFAQRLHRQTHSGKTVELNVDELRPDFDTCEKK